MKYLKETALKYILYINKIEYKIMLKNKFEILETLNLKRSKKKTKTEKKKI